MPIRSKASWPEGPTRFTSFQGFITHESQTAWKRLSLPHEGQEDEWFRACLAWRPHRHLRIQWTALIAVALAAVVVVMSHHTMPKNGQERQPPEAENMKGPQVSVHFSFWQFLGIGL